MCVCVVYVCGRGGILLAGRLSAFLLWCSSRAEQNSSSGGGGGAVLQPTSLHPEGWTLCGSQKRGRMCVLN